MTPKPKAKIKFCKFENALAMQVIYMDERFRKTKGVWPCHLYQGFQICSLFSPFLKVNSIALLGSNNYLDNIILEDTYISESERDDYLMGFINILKDWAKNWEGWKGEPAIEPVITEYPGGVVEVLV